MLFSIPGNRTAHEEVLGLLEGRTLLNADLLSGLEGRRNLRAGRLKVRKALRVGVPGVRGVCKDDNLRLNRSYFGYTEATSVSEQEGS